MVKVPCIKRSEIVEIDFSVTDRNGQPTGEKERRSETILTRNDATAFLSIISQMDLNEAEQRKRRRMVAKLGRVFRKWSFDTSVADNIEGHVELSEELVETLYDICCKDVPAKVEIRGIQILDSLDSFEDWYDGWKREPTEPDKE